MSLAVKSVSSAHIYSGNAEVKFFPNDEKGLSVTIDTKRLHIRSIFPSEEEYERLSALYGDPIVMQKLLNGETKDERAGM